MARSSRPLSRAFNIPGVVLFWIRILISEYFCWKPCRCFRRNRCRAVSVTPSSMVPLQIFLFQQSSASASNRCWQAIAKEELFLHGLAYMVDHPRRVWSSHVAANRAMANCGYAVVRGKDPVATGRLGDILAFAKEAPDSEAIVQVAVGRVDGITLMPDVWYGVDLTRRTVN